MEDKILMQRIRLIFEHLKCKEIIDFLNHWSIDKLKLLNLAIESKIGYDLLILDEENRKFIEEIDEATIYTVAEYGQLMIYISNMGDPTGRFNPDSGILDKFQSFHKMLYKTGNLLLKLLVENPQIESNSKESQNRTANSQEVNNPIKVVPINFSKLMNSPPVGNQQPSTNNVQNEDKLKQQQVNNTIENHDIHAQILVNSQPNENSLENKSDTLLQKDDEVPLNNFLKSLANLDIPPDYN